MRRESKQSIIEYILWSKITEAIYYDQNHFNCHVTTVIITSCRLCFVILHLHVVICESKLNVISDYRRFKS